MLGFLNCDDVCMRVFDESFELLEFVVYVNLQNDVWYTLRLDTIENRDSIHSVLHGEWAIYCHLILKVITIIAQSMNIDYVTTMQC